MRARCPKYAKISDAGAFAVLLVNRGIKTAAEARRFIGADVTGFYDPFLMKDMDAAVTRIKRALDSGEKICIYGDYDVDGVTSVSCLYLYLKSKGADAFIKIPKRDGEGYGVSKNAIDSLAELGVTLIVTVDTGITAVEEADYARELGIDFVITDHHECRQPIPEACAVVNPHRPDCPYPFRELAGVGVVFKLISAFAWKYSHGRYESREQCDRAVCGQYADLCAIGTIADVMPLTDENRIIVREGLALLSETGRPGLEALIKASGIGKITVDPQNRKITAGQVGFGLAPRLNAAGRMTDAMEAVSLLLAEEEAQAEILAENLCEINSQRQKIESEIANDAFTMIEQTHDFENDRVIVLANDLWHPGIIGIVASRITEKYGLPSILISFADTQDDPSDFDNGKGSGRSVRGINLVLALSHCSDLLVKYGGHELAAGLTVKRGDVDAFRRKINEYARMNFDADIFRVNIKYDAEVSAAELTYELARRISLLSLSEL